MKNKIKNSITAIIMIISLFCASFAFGESIDHYTLMTEEFPPVNFQENGKLKGIAIDVLDLILKKMNSKLSINDVKLLPWARAYNMAQNKERTVLFGMTRRPAREKMFKWVGPVAVSKNSIIARKDKNIKIENLTDLNNYRIAVVKDAVGELILTNAGVPKGKLLQIAGTDASNRCAKMLNIGKADLWSYDEITAKWIIRSLGHNLDDFQVVYSFPKSKDMYIAFHKNTPDSLIDKCQQIFNGLKQAPKDGGKSEYEKILDKYLTAK